jgi:subfamily B ATP-binding cassette protein MsbA
MKEIKTVINLLREYYNILWDKIIISFFVISLSSFFITIQPLILASIMEIVIPDNVSSVNYNQIQNLNVFNLNIAGKIVIDFLENFIKFSNFTIYSKLIFLSITYLFLVFASSILSYIGIVVGKWGNATMVVALREKILKHFFNLDYLFFSSNKIFELVSRIFNDAKPVAQGLIPLIQTFLQQGSLIIIYSFFLYSTNNFIFLVAFIILLFHYLIVQFLREPIKNSIINVNNKSANLLSTISETLNSIRIIKAFNTKFFHLNKINRDLLEERKFGFKAAIVDELQQPINNILTALSVVIIFFILMGKFLSGEISLQGGVLFLVIGRLLIQPLLRFSTCFTWIISLYASNHRIQELLNLKSKIVGGIIKKTEFNSSIEIKNLNFFYENKKNNIFFKNIRIMKGEKIAIVGSSGGGKTTLVDLIIRLYDPKKGFIKMDGINIKRYNLQNYRSLFGLIPQDPFLYNDTIKNNIIYGRQDISEEKIEYYSKLVKAHDFIIAKPNGYNTVVGDRGIQLSGGEKQRICMARALVREPQILIFDEATSSLDSNSEKFIQNSLDKILENKTAILIAHRFSTIIKANKIIVLENGRIDNIGNHKYLMKKSSIYKNLFNLQIIKDAN